MRPTDRNTRVSHLHLARNFGKTSTEELKDKKGTQERRKKVI